MKKVSIAASKHIRNFSEHKLTIGLDLGDRVSHYCVLDETGRILMEQKVSTTPKALQATFGAMPRSRIALETGMHSPWVSRLLRELGHDVVAASNNLRAWRAPSWQRDNRTCRALHLRVGWMRSRGKCLLPKWHSDAMWVEVEIDEGP